MILKELENQVKINFGEHSAFYMQILGNISSILSNTRNFKEAINLKRKALDLRTKAFGEFHLITVGNRQDLISNYINIKKFKQAEKLIDKNDKVIQLKDFEREVNIRHLLNKVELLFYKKNILN